VEAQKKRNQMPAIHQKDETGENYQFLDSFRPNQTSCFNF